jgi:hypothetical protein
MMNAMHLLVDLDRDAVRVTTELRWSPMTAVLVLASAWWVKGPLLVAAAWCADLRNGRVLPLVALAATLSFAPSSTGAVRRTRSASGRLSACRTLHRSRPAMR